MHHTVIAIDNEVAKCINKLDLKPFSFQEKSSWQFCSYTISFYVLKNTVRMTAHWSNAPLSVFRKQLYVDPGSNGCFATRFSGVLQMFHLQGLLTAGKKRWVIFVCPAAYFHEVARTWLLKLYAYVSLFETGHVLKKLLQRGQEQKR